MRPIPITDAQLAIERQHGPAERVVIGESGDPTRTDVRPCEYIVTPSQLYPGRSCFTVILALDDTDREAITDGAHLALTFDGAEVAWAVATFQPARGGHR